MIKKLRFKLAGSLDKIVDINLQNKNLIITGANGCGKTRLVKLIHNHLEDLLRRDIKTYENHKEDLIRFERQLQNSSPSDVNYNYYKDGIKRANLFLDRLANESIEFSDYDLIFALSNENKLVLRFFEANRQNLSLASNGNIESIASIKDSSEKESLRNDFSNKFEKYLVGYYNYASHLIARESDKTKSAVIDAWFDKIRTDLRSLFEDETLNLEYNPEQQVFYITQNGKEPFRFNNLSSGYSSILSIYADLLMKVELSGIPANEMTGIVIIDEIDAHLHVSIQKKIFSFFDSSFPKIQFIVTTHSPFVVQSVNNAIIYDISKMECLEDLSMYSYQAILKGLLGVESISSILEERIEKISSLINERPINKEKLKAEIDSISPHEKNLNKKSLSFLLMAKNAILDLDNEEDESDV